MSENLLSRVLSHVTLTLICSLIMGFIPTDQLRLRQVNVMFRHGDRTPIYGPLLFPNDPNMFKPNLFYPIGYASLTNGGKLRMYRLGEFLRNRSWDLLGTEYLEKNVYAVSSASPRTKMSLQLVLAALYPPSLSRNKWHPTLDWQPMVANYIEFSKDAVFTFNKCEKFLEARKQVLNLPEVKRKYEELDDFVKYVGILAGKRENFTYDHAFILQDNIITEKHLHLPMPAWMHDLANDERLLNVRMLFYEIDGYTEYLRRMHIGLFMRQITESMLSVINKTKDPRKISLYSGHEQNIIAVLKALNCFESHIPVFGSALIFELFSKKDKFYVQLVYYKGTPEKLKYLTIPGCSRLCPFDHFLRLTENLRITDEELNCTTTVATYWDDENIKN